MTQIAICEDCPSQSQEIKALLVNYAEERPHLAFSETLFSSGEKLLIALDNNVQFDVFLTILSGADGIELARKMRERGINAPIIFVTDTADYALAAFDVKAKDYLMQPVETERFFATLDECFFQIRQSPEPFFTVAAQGRIVRLPFSSIMCVELSGRTMKVTLNNGSVFISKTIREPFNLAIEPLLQDKRFIYAHKSYVLNMRWVKELTKDVFIMQNDEAVPVPRYKHAKVKQRFMEFCTEYDKAVTQDEGDS